MGTLRLVEQGKLALDEDLNRFLVAWKVPDNEFTAKKPSALREALSHTAGFIQPIEGWRGYADSERVPTLVQILRGEPSANSPAAVVDMLPGSKFRYSGCGYLAIQQAVIDVTGKPFPKVMDTSVFDPLGMRSSTFEQPAPAGFEAIAAVGHDRDRRTNRRKMAHLSGDGCWRPLDDVG